MSVSAIEQALREALATMTALATGYENAKFTPTAAPYQRVSFMLATPANPEMSSNYIEQGIMQVDLYYPANAGSYAAMARADLIRTTFPRGASFTASGATVHVTKTPEIRGGRQEGDRWVVPVRIPFHSHTGS